LKIKATDKKSFIVKIQVSVNGVPLFGKNGYRVDGRKQDVSLTLDIPLNQKTNNLRVSALNANGFESNIETRTVVYNAPVSKPDLYLISIGVSNFNDSKYNLQYASKDARDFAAMFQNRDFVAKIHQTVLIDGEFNAKRLTELKKQLLKSNVDDRVVVFIASHGLLDNQLNYYFATSAVNFDNPAENGLPYEQLEMLVDSIPARNKLIMIDACHAGEVDTEGMLLAEASNSEGHVNFRGFKKPKRTTNLANINTYELMQQLFADLRRGTGATVIAASGGAEFALESDEWKNGVFTYSLISQTRGTEKEPKRYNKVNVSQIEEKVFPKVVSLTQGMQNPVIRQRNQEVDFVFWE
jgi:hypothetical protein